MHPAEIEACAAWLLTVKPKGCCKTGTYFHSLHAPSLPTGWWEKVEQAAVCVICRDTLRILQTQVQICFPPPPSQIGDVRLYLHIREQPQQLWLWWPEVCLLLWCGVCGGWQVCCSGGGRGCPTLCKRGRLAHHHICEEYAFSAVTAVSTSMVNATATTTTALPSQPQQHMVLQPHQPGGWQHAMHATHIPSPGDHPLPTLTVQRLFGG
eukprot:TRINITY_DN10915_c0_g1_i1.p1 TRINITY_DN10915_c0_g1~~TRINITY_DN10915_c0_g1_i1.p1  ORF type:complete len:209 (+),score=39.82 TRINITY_DN10915_c0_g1_i1:301-927(+)